MSELSEGIQDMDKIAKQFYEDTGKCAPYQMSIEEDYREGLFRNDLWSAWCRGRIRGLEADSYRDKLEN